MMQENRYDFRKRLDVVHKPNRRDPDAQPAADEIVIDSSWNICIGNNPSAEILAIARDLHDYFMVSMKVILSFTETTQPKSVAFAIKNKGQKRGHHLKLSEKGVTMAGNDLEGVR